MAPDTRNRDVRIRLAARVLAEIVQRETFESYADLKAALGGRLARLRIPYDAGTITAALDGLERGGARPLVLPRERPPHPRGWPRRRDLEEAAATLHGPDRVEARRLLAELQAGAGGRRPW